MHKALPKAAPEVKKAEARKAANTSSSAVLQKRKSLTAARLIELEDAVKVALLEISGLRTSDRVELNPERRSFVKKKIGELEDVLDKVRRSRHLSVTADAYRDITSAASTARKAQKAVFAHTLMKLVGMSGSEGEEMMEKPIGNAMVDIMKCLSYDGSGYEGPSLRHHIVAKIRKVLLRYIPESCGKNLEQLHLMVDTPSWVVPHKTSKYGTRDARTDSAVDSNELGSCNISLYAHYGLDDSIVDIFNHSRAPQAANGYGASFLCSRSICDGGKCVEVVRFHFQSLGYLFMEWIFRFKCASS